MPYQGRLPYNYKSPYNTTLDQGTQTVPSLAFLGDTNNGLFSPATDNVAITTNGSEKLRVTDTGNVGIGTTNPIARLDVASGIYQSVRTYLPSITDTYHLYRGTPDGVGYEHTKVFSGRDSLTYSYGSYLAFYTEGKNSGTTDTSTERLRINSIGNVGIGTTNPVKPLHATGEVQFSTNTKTHVTHLFTTENADDGIYLIKNASSTDRVLLHSNGSSYLNGGNVGIGTTNPSSKLDVNGTARFGSAVYLNGSVLGLSQSMEVSSSGYGTLAAFRTVPNDGINPYLLIETSTDGITLTSDGSSYRSLFLKTGGSTRIKLDTSGNFTPSADATQNLGSTSFRWANIYSADLQLSNEGSSNDVDGTWGQYTIQEGENDLFLLNRRNGKKYKFVLQEVN